MLVLTHISARYGRRQIFQGASLIAGAGEIIGLIGPNGAGKTTLLRMAAGLIRPAAGRISRTGAVLYYGGEPTLPPGCRADRWAARVGEIRAPKRRLGQMSRGTRQLVGLSAHLSRTDWKIGLLDEPWEGLDPEGARWLSREIGRHRERGAALVVSSHRLHDVADACDSFAMLAKGALRWPLVSLTGESPDSADDLARLFHESYGR